MTSVPISLRKVVDIIRRETDISRHYGYGSEYDGCDRIPVDEIEFFILSALAGYPLCTERNGFRGEGARCVHGHRHMEIGELGHVFPSMTDRSVALQRRDVLGLEPDDALIQRVADAIIDVVQRSDMSTQGPTPEFRRALALAALGAIDPGP
ncbi:MAG: hypothetical protein U0Q19_01290 [Kineosporiaceae bacterium]